MDPVRFSFWICPHITFRVSVECEWGTFYTYTFRHDCDVCGPVSETMLRPPHVGEARAA